MTEFGGDANEPTTPAIVRDWLEMLQLSDTEGADALDLGNRDVVMREYKSGKRIPGPPTLRLMVLTAYIVDALVLLRCGRAFEAKTRLEAMLTPALARSVDQRAPGPMSTP